MERKFVQAGDTNQAQTGWTQIELQRLVTPFNSRLK